MVLCSLNSFKFFFLFFNGFLICLSHFSTCQQYLNPEDPLNTELSGLKIVDNSLDQNQVEPNSSEIPDSIETIKTPKTPKTPLTPKVPKNPKSRNPKTVPDTDLNNSKLQNKPDDSFSKESHDLELPAENFSNKPHMDRERGEYSSHSQESESEDNQPDYQPDGPNDKSGESRDQEDSSEEASDEPKIRPVINP